MAKRNSKISDNLPIDQSAVKGQGTDGRSLFGNYVTIHFALSLSDVFDQAKLYIQAVGIKTEVDFYTWRTTTLRPDTFPPDPYRYYGDEFEGWGKFLGTNRVANQDKEYWEYDEAKAFLKQLHIQSKKSFNELFDIGVIPSQIPKRADAYYMKQGTWVSFSDFLSIEAKTK
jgi:hypothetical protein